MRKNFVSRIAAVALAGALSLTALAGCMQQTTAVSEEQEANRAYMTQVNQKMDALADKLDSFSDAVSRNDLVSMRTQADQAFKLIDEVSGIEAPEVLAEVKTGYVEGCTALEDALSSYIDLYTEAETADGTFDASAYDERLASIQKLYDEGVAKLEEADAKASEL